MTTGLTSELPDRLAMAELDADVDASAMSAGRARPGWQVPPQLQADAPTWIWFGVAVVILGFALITVAWGEVAGQAQVHLQLPYVVSAGLFGLGLVMVGLTVLNIASRHRDRVERDHQMTQLLAILDELHHTFTNDRERRP